LSPYNQQDAADKIDDVGNQKEEKIKFCICKEFEEKIELDSIWDDPTNLTHIPSIPARYF
jgi:hypothetical protein